MAKDIVDALMLIAHEFRSLNLLPPDVIILKDHDEGMRLLTLLHQNNYLMIPLGSDRAGKIIEHPDGSVWMQADVYGMKVRWPAKKYATKDGGYVWT